MEQRLWLTTYFADLAVADALEQIAVDYALAPARAAWGLPAPRADEGDDYLFVDIEPIGGVRARAMRPHHLTASAAHFDPVLRGLLLFGWLFPTAVAGTGHPTHVIELPGTAFLTRSQTMAYRSYAEVRYLAHGALGLRAPFPSRASALLSPAPNPAALHTLRVMQDLITRALGKAADFGDYRRIDGGLASMDATAASELDDILRIHVRPRLIHLVELEPVERDDDPDGAGSYITFDQGVFTATVPESLAGLVALDFVESLRLDRAAGVCAKCRRPFLLSAQQSARAARGDAVFHAACQRDHRLDYWRDYQRRRRESSVARPRPTN